MSRIRWAQLVAAALLVGLVPAGCAMPEETSGEAATETTKARAKTPKTTEAKPEADASAQLACTHFRNIMGDVGQGLLTDAELRDKLKEVHSSASVSSWPGLPAASTAMLAAITTGTADDLLAAAKKFDGACDKAGL